MIMALIRPLADLLWQQPVFLKDLVDSLQGLVSIERGGLASSVPQYLARRISAARRLHLWILEPGGAGSRSAGLDLLLLVLGAAITLADPGSGICKSNRRAALARRVYHL